MRTLSDDLAGGALVTLDLVGELGVTCLIGHEDDVVAVGVLDVSAVRGGLEIGQRERDEDGEVGVRAGNHLRVNEVDLAPEGIAIAERLSLQGT